MHRWTPIAILAFTLALPAWAATTGQVRVSVVDEATALPIPGVELHLKCLTEQAATTDANGEALFTEVEPSTCTLQVQKAGWHSVLVENLRVDVGRTRVQRIELGTGMAEQVVTSSKRSAVDVESTGRSQALTREFLKKIPAGRSYQTAVTFAAGVQEGSGGNPNLAGAAYNENVYIGEFDDYGVNPVELAESDRFSTFAVDVDTASYTVARRSINGNRLPDEASVRVEEFVNAIDYAYPPVPAGSTMPFAVHMEAAPHPFDPGRKVLLRVGLQGEEVKTETRKPVRLTFLVDVSGSMSSPDKLGLAKTSLHYLVDHLGLEDEVALVTYAGRVQTVLEPTFTTRTKAIHAAIDELGSGGGTGMSDGMALAYEMAQRMYLDGAENRVIVLSDGDANIGRTSHAAILDQLAEYAGQGITLSTVGFGMGNYKDTMMEQLADKGDGNYAYVDSEAEARRLFGADVGSTLVTIARDVKVQVEFPPESVLAYRLLGYENREVADADFRKDEVDGGEIGAGHQVTALYELDLTSDPGEVLAKVHVRAKPPGKDRYADEHVTAIGTAQILGDLDASDDSTRLAFGVATFAELLRRSPHVAEVSFDQVIALIEGAIDRTDPMHVELVGLVEKARDLDRARVSSR
jgi:Ca-activated chloride channel family protein